MTVLRRLSTQRSAALALAVVALLVLAAIAAPVVGWLTGNSPTEFHGEAVDPALGGLPRGAAGGISAEHWLGVEPVNGRDVLTRVVYGARVSLLIAVFATALSVLLGTTLGLLAGFLGGWVDTLIGRLMDLLMSFPGLIFMIALISAAPGADRGCCWWRCSGSSAGRTSAGSCAGRRWCWPGASSWRRPGCSAPPGGPCCCARCCPT
ncbi:hypothetical protein ACFQ0T_02445 [Kitasatospora gansuensis]